MGMFQVRVRVSHPRDSDYFNCDMVVDTGAIYSKLPDSILRETLGIEPDREDKLQLADTEWKTYPVGEARFQIGDRASTARVIFGEEDCFILGATSLQELGLVPDTTEHQLVPAPLMLIGIKGQPYLG